MANILMAIEEVYIDGKFRKKRDMLLWAVHLSNLIVEELFNLSKNSVLFL